MKSKTWTLIVGVVSLLGGVFALLNPLAATITAELMTGYLFMMVGVLMLLSIFSDDRWGSRILSLVLGIAILVVGFNLVTKPLEGVLSLTLIVAVLMLFIGVLRIVFAFQMPTAGLKVALILAGVVSLVLGVMILSNFPFSAAVVLGIMLAVELISTGVSLIIIALSRTAEES